MSHGPECPLPDPRLRGFAKSDCQCVLCHCGPDHVPGGFLGTCQRCGRKREQDLLTNRGAS